VHVERVVVQWVVEEVESRVRGLGVGLGWDARRAGRRRIRVLRRVWIADYAPELGLRLSAFLLGALGFRGLGVLVGDARGLAVPGLAACP
jgi:hypothetical protein